MRITTLAAATAFALTAATPALAQTVTYNSNPVGGFHFGAGNDYSPADAAVLTTASGEQLALRFHNGAIAPAPPSDPAGVYTFALGTTPINYDFSLSATITEALITVTNVGTGQSANYNPFFPGNDNNCNDVSCQNSARLNFGFLLGSGFTPNIDSTYSVTLTAAGSSLTTFAQIGAGAVAAVPEPSTWALMLLGFGGMGVAMRRRRRTSTILVQAA